MTLKLAFFVALFSIPFSGFSQTDSGQLHNSKMIIVNKDIYMLQGAGGNIGLSFGNDGVFMIDDQFADGIVEVQNEIKRISKKPIQFLVNTHFHGDHTGGNAALAKEGTLIFAHENVRSRLERAIQNSTVKIDANSLPIITFTEDITFHFNGEKIFVFHIHNAHTDGDAVVYFTESNVIHTGDVFVEGQYPVIDTENGGTLQGYIDGLERIALVINDGTKIIPGHGNVATLKDVRYLQDMLTFLYKRVSYFYGNKKTEEQIAAMKDLTAEYDGKGFGKGDVKSADILRTIYKAVEKDNAGVKSNNEKNREAAEKIEEIKKIREGKKG